MLTPGNYPLTVGISNGDTRATGWTTIPFRNGKSREYHRSVRVSDFVTNAVGFIGEWQGNSDHSEGQPGDMHGTGFFVSVPSTVHGVYLYFVTARHVAEGLRDYDVCITVNKRGGGVVEVFAPEPPMWYLHPTDKTSDVAVTQIVNVGDADIIPVPVGELLTAQDTHELDIGIGDEIFVTGLFSEVPSTTRNIPIIRHGNISMMPSEQIQTGYGYADVCLVEARSIGGLSGSPVFVRPTANVPLKNAAIGGFLVLTDQVKLLGVMHGHWDVKESEINNPKLCHDRKQGVNYGIAIVTPATKIIETLNRRELKDTRMLGDEVLKKCNAPTMDSAKKKNEGESDDPPFTREDFETALKKASRKLESSKKA
jgi:hypothetical protein